MSPQQWKFVWQKYLKWLPFRLSKMGHNSTEAIQDCVEAERRVYDRSYYLGDPDFVKFL
jgi:gamma-glutamyltranspeptidase